MVINTKVYHKSTVVSLVKPTTTEIKIVQTARRQQHSISLLHIEVVSVVVEVSLFVLLQYVTIHSLFKAKQTFLL